MRKRSSPTASTTIRATSSGSAMFPATIVANGELVSPSIGVRTPSGASRDTRIPRWW
jgi:hypothetical protein